MGLLNMFYLHETVYFLSVFMQVNIPWSHGSYIGIYIYIPLNLYTTYSPCHLENSYATYRGSHLLRFTRFHYISTPSQHQGATLQNYNNELVKSIEVLRAVWGASPLVGCPGQDAYLGLQWIILLGCV